MTERGAASVTRDASTLAIGPSRLRWDGATLTIDVDEVTAPWPSRLRGRIRVTPTALHALSLPLDSGGRHRWTPMAPAAEVEVDFARPASRWRGVGYLDGNHGDRPLEHDFRAWHWSRSRHADGATTVLYDVTRRDGSEQGLAFRFDADGARTVAAPPLARLPSSRWRVARTTRADAGATPAVVESLEDGPFYARSVVRSRLFGDDTMAVHESLDLDRFTLPWVQAMLPFRVPRRG